MVEVLAATLAFPTILLTVPLGVVLLYWLLVVAGAFELPSHGAHDGLADGGLHGDAGHDGLGEGAEGLAALLSALRLRSAPITVVLSVLVLVSWLLCAASVPLVAHASGAPVGWLVGLGVLLAALLVAVPLTSLLVRPLGDLFVVHQARRHEDLLGRECVVETGRIDGKFGQARMEDGGAGLLLQIRCDGANNLRRGDRALLLYWDEARQAYAVEPLDRAEGKHARVKEESAPEGETSPGREEQASERGSRKEQV